MRPEHLPETDPEDLVREFQEILKRRADVIERTVTRELWGAAILIVGLLSLFYFLCAGLAS